MVKRVIWSGNADRIFTKILKLIIHLIWDCRQSQESLNMISK